MSVASIAEGQILTGVMFNEPMRVVTTKQGGAGTMIAGLVGQNSRQFREVTLTEDDISRLNATASYDGDGDLLKLAFQAYPWASPAWTPCPTNWRPSTSTS